MLMVVIGAGASYDSIPSLSRYRGPIDARPPLANELFAPRDKFKSIRQRFPACHAIVPGLENLPPDKTLEQVLEHLQTEAGEYPVRNQQLAAVRYYLHTMLWQCEDDWKTIAKGITNYKALLDQIERWRKPDEQVCLVTFNYDRLIEDALPEVGVIIQELSDYTSNDKYKLFKLHGSVDWGRLVDTPIARIGELNAWQIAHELIKRVTDLKITDQFQVVKGSYPMGKVANMALFPAIAIPVQSKTHFECPAQHLHVLKTMLPTITKLLMIGWRATENHFLKLLQECIPHQLRVMTVSGSPDGAKESVANLRKAKLHIDVPIESSNGFTDFIVNREGDGFLSS
jgi:hypothetical protein